MATASHGSAFMFEYAHRVDLIAADAHEAGQGHAALVLSQVAGLLRALQATPQKQGRRKTISLVTKSGTSLIDA